MNFQFLPKFAYLTPSTLCSDPWLSSLWTSPLMSWFVSFIGTVRLTSWIECSLYSVMFIECSVIKGSYVLIARYLNGDMLNIGSGCSSVKWIYHAGSAQRVPEPDLLPTFFRYPTRLSFENSQVMGNPKYWVLLKIVGTTTTLPNISCKPEVSGIPEIK